mmetsp:Transcript_153777/g.493100  ORF Transcript_153777/g.493100 Transcript_153777/m.493100 type:complete len:320 (-) Transcript_153777:17-976(-)
MTQVRSQEQGQQRSNHDADWQSEHVRNAQVDGETLGDFEFDRCINSYVHGDERTQCDLQVLRSINTRHRHLDKIEHGILPGIGNGLVFDTSHSTHSIYSWGTGVSGAAFDIINFVSLRGFGRLVRPALFLERGVRFDGGVRFDDLIPERFQTLEHLRTAQIDCQFDRGDWRMVVASKKANADTEKTLHEDDWKTTKIEDSLENEGKQHGNEYEGRGGPLEHLVDEQAQLLCIATSIHPLQPPAVFKFIDEAHCTVEIFFLASCLVENGQDALVFLRCGIRRCDLRRVIHELFLFFIMIGHRRNTNKHTNDGGRTSEPAS